MSFAKNVSSARSLMMTCSRRAPRAPVGGRRRLWGRGRPTGPFCMGRAIPTGSEFPSLIGSDYGLGLAPGPGFAGRCAPALVAEDAERVDPGMPGERGRAEGINERAGTVA